MKWQKWNFSFSVLKNSTRTQINLIRWRLIIVHDSENFRDHPIFRVFVVSLQTISSFANAGEIISNKRNKGQIKVREWSCSYLKSPVHRVYPGNENTKDENGQGSFIVSSWRYVTELTVPRTRFYEKRFNIYSLII